MSYSFIFKVTFYFINIKLYFYYKVNVFSWSLVVFNNYSQYPPPPHKTSSHWTYSQELACWITYSCLFCSLIKGRVWTQEESQEQALDLRFYWSPSLLSSWKPGTWKSLFMKTLVMNVKYFPHVIKSVGLHLHWHKPFL